MQENWSGEDDARVGKLFAQRTFGLLKVGFAVSQSPETDAWSSISTSVAKLVEY